ncbi:diacylglycerol kinase [Polymorphobacter glacialis]|uniref:Diacylglycerol kinase n=1 Tax=Sandarakinorhabdus glacialis TaxID=1614636 RepID=A0A916ZSG3_9SPHN|nr:cytochrome c [Polymorphobacter glacialis]GGE11678.1 diacylglycerol kinase [Polymorphobacter glacialis]
MKRLAILALGLIAIGAALFYALTIPDRLPPSQIATLATASPTRGARIFWAGGCASCHAPAGARGNDRLNLPGGAPIETPFGTFHAPNISPHPDGIGRWNLADFANAMQRGVDPRGRHLYPAFPYTSYVHMTAADIADLFAYIRTLPPVPGTAPANALSFPFNIRRGIGLWKLAFMPGAAPVVALPASAGPAARAGQYLVEGPGHCGQCHTPRSFGGAGAMQSSQWLSGAPSPEGKGQILNITPGSKSIGSWSTAEIAEYLATGFTPDYDSVGGSMADVQRNLAMLPRADHAAIAAYLKAIPAH